MPQVIPSGTPGLAAEKTSDYAADQRFNGDFVFRGILLSVAPGGFTGSREAPPCSGGSVVTFSFISPKLMGRRH